MDRQALQERFGITGTAPALVRQIDRARQVARTDISVLIEGESGVGKELFAQAIHELSTRRHKSLIVVNCGAIPEGLIESELFGNEKGAYTGAVERRQGYFEQADNGTIFLDEIGEMPQAAQVRLLRVLENGTFSRIGGSTVLRTDVRIIAATNKDLGREVQAGRFREDLYYRLNTVVLRIPPLREREDDILVLFERFLHQFSQKYDVPQKRLDEGARRLLMQYRWPGNVRELRNVAEQSVVLHRGIELIADNLRGYLRGISAAGINESLVPMSTVTEDTNTGARERELIYRGLLELRLEIRDLKKQVGTLVTNLGTFLQKPSLHHKERDDYLIVRNPDQEPYIPPIEDAPYEIEDESDGAMRARTTPRKEETPMVLQTLESAERKLIMEALHHFEGNRRQTARALGISERTLYRKLKELEEEV